MFKVWRAGLALLTAAALASAAHAGGVSSGSSSSGGGTIKIGVAGPLTGSDAAFGAQLKNGAEQAVQDINAAGGILGKKLEVLIGDDVGDPKQGVSVANKFAGEG